MKKKNDNEKAYAEAMEKMAKSMENKELSFDNWQCNECEGQPTFTHAEMRKHLLEVHQIDLKTAKGTQKMTMHLDGKDWYQTNYEIEIDGKKFARFVRNERAADDMMRWV
jgi:hypothetical protein